MAKANDKQVGGTHYQEVGATQHWDLAAELYGEAHFKCTATKYVMRWRKKNGQQDLEKAKHYLEKLIELVDSGHVVLQPSTQYFIQNVCERVQGMVWEDWAVVCRIFAAETSQDLRDEIGRIDSLVATLHN